MWTREEIIKLKNSISKWKEVIPEIIAKLYTSGEDNTVLIHSFQTHLEERKTFVREEIVGLLDFNQRNHKFNTLNYNFINLCDSLPRVEEKNHNMITEVNGDGNQIYQNVNNTTIVQNVNQSSNNVNLILTEFQSFIDSAQDFHSIIRVSKKVFTDQKSLAVIENLEKYWNPTVDITVYKKQIVSILEGEKMDVNFMKGVYDNVASIGAQIKAEMKIKVNQVQVNEYDLIDEIISVYKNYIKFWKSNFVVFPELALEAKDVANDILSKIELSVTSNDLNEIKKIQSSLVEYAEALVSFQERVKEGLEGADNDEKNVILKLLSEQTPKWTKFKEALKVLKSMGLDSKISFPEVEPSTDIKKRLLKQDIFNLIGR